MYHFISYSSTDGLDFAFKLVNELEAGPPSILTWIDKRNLNHSDDWDKQIEQAIQNCDSLIFIMTRDSVDDLSVCKVEWVQALKFKKPIIPLRLHYDADLPFRINSRNYIDFCSDFASSIAQLRRHLSWLNTTEGLIESVRYRLSDAQRTLQRCTIADRARIEKEIEKQKSELSRLQRILESPEVAEEQTSKSIQIRIEGEQKPISKTVVEKRAKFVNPPPMSSPDYFQDRIIETQLSLLFLKNQAQRIMTIIGRGGVGKTAMICRLLKALEAGKIPAGLDNEDEYQVEIGGIVYLSELGSHRVSFANIYGDLCRLLPQETASRLDIIYRDNQRSIKNKMIELLEEFNNKPCVLLLDNLETYIDSETFELTQADLYEALRTILEAPHHTLKVLITTRIPLSDLQQIAPQRQQVIRLDAGLNSPHAETLLRALDYDGTIGFKNASDECLKKIQNLTKGFPRALEAFYGILAADISTSLSELITKAQATLPERIVEELVGEAFCRLDRNSQMVMKALAIYARPVPPVAIDFLLQPFISTIDSVPILNHLVNMHFVRKEQGRFYLHPIDHAFSLNMIPNINNKNSNIDEKDFTQKSLHRRASEYFRQIRRPRSEWKNLSDIEPQIAEFEMRYFAEDYESALWIINEIDFAYLSKWGHAHIVVQMREKLIDNLVDDNSLIQNLTFLGSAFVDLGDTRKIFSYCEKALQLSQQNNNTDFEAINLGTLGVAYRRIGEISKAISYYQNALVIDQNLHYVIAEAINLDNIAVAYRYLGLINKSFDLYNQAILIYQKYNKRSGLMTNLCNCSLSYREIGKVEKAIHCCSEALNIAIEEKDKRWECISYGNLSIYYMDLGASETVTEMLDAMGSVSNCTQDIYSESLCHIYRGKQKLLLGDYQNAFTEYSLANETATDNNNVYCQIESRIGISLIKLKEGQYESALRYVNSVKKSEYGLSLIDIKSLAGIIYLRMGRIDEAKKEFYSSIEFLRNLLRETPQMYRALEAKALAYCGLVLCDGTQHLDQAIADYKSARDIISLPGVIKNASLFYKELIQADVTNMLSGVCEVVNDIHPN